MSSQDNHGLYSSNRQGMSYGGGLFLSFCVIVKRSFIIIVPRCISSTLFSSLFLFSNLNVLPLSTRASFYHLYFLKHFLWIYILILQAHMVVAMLVGCTHLVLVEETMCHGIVM